MAVLAVLMLMLTAFLHVMNQGTEQDVTVGGNDLDMDDLHYLATRLNRVSPVLNAAQFALAPDHVPIVIYVYQRHKYLLEVLRHLRRATGINETLLIVSHDGTVPAMLELVEREADFCQVKILIHPVGSHRPCDFDGCPIFRLKEHWWWLQQTVWDAPEVTSITSSPWRIFLEEDHCVTADAYLFVKEMIHLAERSLGVPKGAGSSCWGIGLAPMMDRTPKLGPEPWDMVDYHWGVQNEGYAFSRDTWNNIKKASNEFLSFHDGWDVSMLHLMQVQLLPALVLLPRLARIRNIGVIGVTTGTISYQASNWYDELGFASAAVSQQSRVRVEDVHVGTRALGKDPRELPYMGAFGSKYDFDAVRPGQLNNNWDGNYGPDVSTHWGVRGDWTAGQQHDDGWYSVFLVCLLIFVAINALGWIVACRFLPGP